MCFSAVASFGAGAALSIIGAAAIKKTQHPSQLAFAAIPLIFAAQQVAEGCIWLALSYPTYSGLLQPATYLFLVLAQVVWPFWVPFALLLLENEPKRKKWLYRVMGLGLLVSAYLTYRLCTQPIHAEIAGMHIYYSVGVVNTALQYSAALYFFVVVGAPFISGISKMWFFGLSIASAYLITILFFEEYELSVWCFFATITSMIVFSILFELKRDWSAKSPGTSATAI